MAVGADKSAQWVEWAVGADLSRPPPHCISHKRGIAETWRNAFPVPIYRPRDDPQHIPVHFLKLIIGPNTHQPKLANNVIPPTHPRICLLPLHLSPLHPTPGLPLAPIVILSAAKDLVSHRHKRDPPPRAPVVPHALL